MNRWLMVLTGVWLVALAMSMSVLSSTKPMPRHVKQAGALTAGSSAAQPVRRAAPARSRMRAPVAVIPQQPATPSTSAPMGVSGPLEIRLVGTLVDEPQAESLAIIEDRATGARQSYRVGEIIAGRRLTEVARGYIMLMSEHGTERVELEVGAAAGEQAAPVASAGVVDTVPWQPIVEQIFRPREAMDAADHRAIAEAIRPVSETERIVDRRKVWASVKGNPFQVMREAGLGPAFTSGRLSGVRITSLPEDGILQRSGFASGDIIRSINGQPVTDSAKLLSLPAQLQQAEVVEVRVERNGQPVSLTYRFQ